MKRKLVLSVIVLFMLVSCSAIRTDVAGPILKEELQWTRMLADWSKKAYASKDFRAGFLVASTKPYLSQMPVVLSAVINDIAKEGDQKSEGWKQGNFGGLTLSFYAVATGQGVRWIMEQLFSLGVIPLNLAGFLMG
jgi:hypothetical protein